MSDTIIGTMKDILTVIVGSQAHGLATPSSDTDYHSIFIHPTSELLRVGASPTKTSWNEGSDNWRVDDTGWELGHFLFLATKSNPSILECFLAPVENATEDGMRLRDLFPYVWDSKLVRDAFIGYGLNQRKKYLENKDNRRPKYAAAYLRSLYQGWELLRTGTFTVRIADTPVGDTVQMFKDGLAEPGLVIETCLGWQKAVEDAYDDPRNQQHKPDFERINDYLLDVRRREWSF